MIIPVRCVTCGKVLGDKWLAYDRRVKEMQKDGALDGKDAEVDVVDVKGRAPRGIILDEMGITRICCRRVLLTHVDLVDVI